MIPEKKPQKINNITPEILNYIIERITEYVNQPNIISHSDGDVDIILSPSISASSFDYTGESDTHISTDWEVSIDDEFGSVVWESLDDTNNLQSIDIPYGSLEYNTQYYIRVRYTGDNYGDSEWSVPVSFNTIENLIFSCDLSSGLQEIDITIRGLGGSTQLDWGDGNTETVQLDGSLQYITHNYGSTGIYQIEFTEGMVNITDIISSNHDFLTGDLSMLSGLTSLENVNLYSNNLTGELSSLDKLKNIVDFKVSGNNLSGDIGVINNWSLAEEIWLYDNDFSCDLPDMSNLTRLNTFFLMRCDFHYGDNTVFPDMSGVNIYLSDNNMTSDDVDNILIDIDSSSPGSGGNLMLGGNNASRTSVSDSAYNSLISKGWNLDVN